jgi:general secretion pathway protein G
MRKQKGFTLIELLIVIAIIGIIAGIAIPNLLDALERARQKRSVADIRTMVIAMQEFRSDFMGYPNVACNGPVVPNLSGLTDLQTQTVIVPSLIQSMPANDGWGSPYQYFGGPPIGSVDPTLGTRSSLHYVIYSLGSDVGYGGGTDGSASAADIASAWCSDPQQAIPGVRATHCFQSDIVWGDSMFEQSPEGKQKKC